MTITSRPATKEYRDNFDATFGGKLPRSFSELRDVCKLRGPKGDCKFYAVHVVCEEPCAAFCEPGVDVADCVRK